MKKKPAGLWKCTDDQRYGQQALHWPDFFYNALYARNRTINQEIIHITNNEAGWSVCFNVKKNWLLSHRFSKYLGPNNTATQIWCSKK